MPAPRDGRWKAERLQVTPARRADLRRVPTFGLLEPGIARGLAEILQMFFEPGADEKVVSFLVLGRLEDRHDEPRVSAPNDQKLFARVGSLRPGRIGSF